MMDPAATAGLTNWLARSGVSRALQNHEWLVPAVQTVHILCIAIVLPMVMLLGLQLAGFRNRGQALASSVRRHTPWAVRALCGLALTGILLILIEPERELPNPAFQIKMALLLGALLLSTAMVRLLGHASSQWARGSGAVPPLGIRLLAGLILLLWLAIVVAGRWIAYSVES